jgi:hypothetical protein
MLSSAAVQGARWGANLRSLDERDPWLDQLFASTAMAALGQLSRELRPALHPIGAAILYHLRGPVVVDLSQVGERGAIAREHGGSAESPTVVTFTGTGTEPAYGLRVEFRGLRFDPLAMTLSSKLEDGQGIVLHGGRNLFASKAPAFFPWLANAVRDGFGAKGTKGTAVSVALAVDSFDGAHRTAALTLALNLTSRTTPEITADLGIRLHWSDDLTEVAIKVAGPCVVKLPGSPDGLQVLTLNVDQDHLVPLPGLRPLGASG